MWVRSTHASEVNSWRRSQPETCGPSLHTMHAPRALIRRVGADVFGLPSRSFRWLITRQRTWHAGVRRAAPLWAASTAQGSGPGSGRVEQYRQAKTQVSDTSEPLSAHVSNERQGSRIPATRQRRTGVRGSRSARGRPRPPTNCARVASGTRTRGGDLGGECKTGVRFATRPRTEPTPQTIQRRVPTRSPARVERCRTPTHRVSRPQHDNCARSPRRSGTGAWG